jgi:hypothetical protein
MEVGVIDGSAIAYGRIDVRVTQIRLDHRRRDACTCQREVSKKPANAKSPQIVAQAILTHYQTGENSDLDL